MAINSNGYIYRSAADANLHINYSGYLSRGVPNMYIDSAGSLYRCGKPNYTWLMGSGMKGYNWDCCVYAENKFVAVGSVPIEGTETYKVARAESKYGYEWEVTEIGTYNAPPIKMAYDGKGNFVIVFCRRILYETFQPYGGMSYIYHSDDECRTLKQRVASDGRITSAAYGSGKFMAIGYTWTFGDVAGIFNRENNPRTGLILMESSDGFSWQDVSAVGIDTKYLNDSGAVHYEKIDTAADSILDFETGSPYQLIEYHFGYFFAVSGMHVSNPYPDAPDFAHMWRYFGQGKIAWSEDGRTWTQTQTADGIIKNNPLRIKSFHRSIYGKDPTKYAEIGGVKLDLVYIEFSAPQRDYFPAYNPNEAWQLQETERDENTMCVGLGAGSTLDNKYYEDGEYPYLKVNSRYPKRLDKQDEYDETDQASNGWAYSLRHQHLARSSSVDGQGTTERPWDWSFGQNIFTPLDIDKSQLCCCVCGGPHIIVALGNQYRTDGNCSYFQTIKDER